MRAASVSDSTSDSQSKSQSNSRSKSNSNSKSDGGSSSGAPTHLAPDTFSYTSVLATLASSGQWREALEVLDMMEADGLKVV